uniref:Uncharacterized protein n=1 Tax=Anguilla anguilla TaxID=7936 RepID=A0A0E9TTM0_ANGAN
MDCIYIALLSKALYIRLSFARGHFEKAQGGV